MADTREQLNTKVSAATRALLVQYCQDKHTTQGDVVEAALLAFLLPREGEDLTLAMLQRLQELGATQDLMGKGLAGLIPLVERIATHVGTQPDETAVPIARYDQMYAALQPQPAPPALPAPPVLPGKPRRFLRWRASS